jgi:hypothetical protein
MQGYRDYFGWMAANRAFPADSAQRILASSCYAGESACQAAPFANARLSARRRTPFHAAAAPGSAADGPAFVIPHLPELFRILYQHFSAELISDAILFAANIELPPLSGKYKIRAPQIAFLAARNRDRIHGPDWLRSNRAGMEQE